MPAENGYVPTPDPVADYLAATALAVDRPTENDPGRLLIPGLGSGNLYAAVERYCKGDAWIGPSEGCPLPDVVGVEIDRDRIQEFHANHPNAVITIHNTDFLLDPPEPAFDWVVMNPPYSRYANIPESKRDTYAESFDVAERRFPLYTLFLEQSLRLLRRGGWLSAIMPESLLVRSLTRPCRKRLRTLFIDHIQTLPRITFDRKVRTIILELHKAPSPSLRHLSLWAHPIDGGYGLELLDRLGADDPEAARDDYWDRTRDLRGRVENYDRREADDLTQEAHWLVGDADDSQQTALQRWSW